MAIQKQTLLINARLVGRAPALYAVLVTDERIEKIVEGQGPPNELWGGVEVVDCRQADGSSLFVSPVSCDAILPVLLLVYAVGQQRRSVCKGNTRDGQTKTRE